MTIETREIMPVVCPGEGCTAMQLMRMRQDEHEEDLKAHKARSTELFDKLFERFDRLQWWLIALLGGIIATLATVLIKGG